VATRKTASCRPAADTADTAKLGYSTPSSSINSGARRRTPSASGAAFRKPDRPAASANVRRLQADPVA
jgi:hypothetical protein